MVADGTYVAVVDRFEEDASGTTLAVVLLEDAGDVVEQVHVPRSDLPTDAGQDAVLRVRVVDGDVVDLEPDPEETARRGETAQERFDRLAADDSTDPSEGE